jgi:2'-5' RNA ligase
MNFFLGFFPDEKSKYSISKIIADIQEVFEDQQMPVRWSKPDSYHMTVLHIGNKLPFYRKILLKRKLKSFQLKNFNIRFNAIKLGISRKYKDLIYLDTKEGGEEMRDLLLIFRKTLGISDIGNFIPHLTLGRVSKDLTKQEYTNICKDLNFFSKKLDVQDISFEVNDIQLIKNDENNYEVLMNLSELSSKSL